MAEAGDVQAMDILARIPKKMPDGKPVPSYEPLYPEWHERAIKTGDKMRELGQRSIDEMTVKHLKDFYLSPLTEEQIAEYIKQAEAGNVIAMRMLARTPKKLPDGTLDTAFAEYWLKRAIAAGDKWLELLDRWNTAMKTGKWEEYQQASREENIQALEADAKNGGQNSALTLGEAYLNPDRLQWPQSMKNFEKSVHWFRVAANVGSREAPGELCALYFNGTKHYGGGGDPDYQEAAKWCLLAAHVGCDALGAINLGQMFEKGLGVPRNLAEALYWGQVANDRWESRDRRLQEIRNR